MNTPRPQESQDDRWLAVLAGEREADDADTRQAAQVRGYFQRMEQDAREHPLDEAGERRVLNVLRAQGVFDAPQGQRGQHEAQQPGFWAALLSWIWPADGPPAQRYALVAGVMAAVLLAPLMMHLTESGQDEGGQIKSVGPPGSTKSIKGLSPGGPGTAQLMAEDPARLAKTLGRELQAAGAEVSTQSAGQDTVLDVAIPAAARERVARVMAQYGVAAPDTASVRVYVRPYR